MKTMLMVLTLAWFVGQAGGAVAAPPATPAATTAAVKSALEDFRKTAVLYQLKYRFEDEPLTGADPGQLELFPFPGSWPSPVTNVVTREPGNFTLVGADDAGYSDTRESPSETMGSGFAFRTPLRRGLTPQQTYSTFLLLGGVSKGGGIVASRNTSVYVQGEMAGLLNLQSYSMTVVRGDLTGTLYCGSYANCVVYGKMSGRMTLTSSTNAYLVGGLSGTLRVARSAKVWIGGTTSEADLKQVNGAGKVFLQASDLKPGTYARGDTEVTVLGGTGAIASTGSDEVKPAVPRHLRPFYDGPDAADVADVTQQDRRAGANPDMRYALIGPAPDTKAPSDGYKLLLVLPGGDGSPDFNPFIRRIVKNALPPGYVVAQLVAPVWNAKQAQELIWPIAKSTVAEAKFTTEQFVGAVVKDAGSVYKINPKAVYALGWSSGGPPVYAALLEENSPLAGAFVAMSIFPAGNLSLPNAKGKAVYLLHSPQDFIKITQAESARDRLAEQGAKTTLTTYKGGHGWHEDPFGHILKGMEWLEASTTPSP